MTDTVPVDSHVVLVLRGNGVPEEGFRMPELKWRGNEVRFVPSNDEHDIQSAAVEAFMEFREVDKKTVVPIMATPSGEDLIPIDPDRASVTITDSRTVFLARAEMPDERNRRMKFADTASVSNRLSRALDRKVRGAYVDERFHVYVGCLTHQHIWTIGFQPRADDSSILSVQMTTVHIVAGQRKTRGIRAAVKVASDDQLAFATRWRNAILETKRRVLAPTGEILNEYNDVINSEVLLNGKEYTVGPTYHTIVHLEST